MQGESVVRAAGWVTKQPDMCIQDQSATSFLSGSEYILRYLKWLEVQGYPMDTISFKKRGKSFRFGGDADGHAHWMVELPVHFANTSGRMHGASSCSGPLQCCLDVPFLNNLALW